MRLAREIGRIARRYKWIFSFWTAGPERSGFFLSTFARSHLAPPGLT